MSEPQQLCPCESGQPFGECHGDEGRWEGLKAIGAALAVDEDTVVAYAARDYDPLPVRVDHAGRRYISKRALASWVNRQDLPFAAWTELSRVRRLPHQRERTKTGPAGRPRRGAAQSAKASKVARRKRAGNSG